MVCRAAFAAHRSPPLSPATWCRCGRCRCRTPGRVRPELISELGARQSRIPWVRCLSDGVNGTTSSSVRAALPPSVAAPQPWVFASIHWRPPRETSRLRSCFSIAFQARSLARCSRRNRAHGANALAPELRRSDLRHKVNGSADMTDPALVRALACPLEIEPAPAVATGALVGAPYAK